MPKIGVNNGERIRASAQYLTIRRFFPPVQDYA